MIQIPTSFIHDSNVMRNVRSFIEDTPNDTELGTKIREMVAAWDKSYANRPKGCEFDDPKPLEDLYESLKRVIIKVIGVIPINFRSQSSDKGLIVNFSFKGFDDEDNWVCLDGTEWATCSLSERLREYEDYIQYEISKRKEEFLSKS